MGSLKSCCVVSFICILCLCIFITLVILPVIWLTPETLYGRLTLAMQRLEAKNEPVDLHAHWGYGLLKKIKEIIPKHWGKKYAECDLNLQSPINFEESQVINNSLLVPVEFVDYDAAPRDDVWTVTNNGHTVKFTAEFTSLPQITGGSLIESPYNFLQLHFHWGSNNSYGSEHAINGKPFPAELHLVHVRKSDSPSPYKLAVIGVFFALKDENDIQGTPEEVTEFLKAAKAVRKPGTTENVTIPGFKLAHLIPSEQQYFRYFGSLTSPPCNQYLQWTVFKSPLPISSSELQIFRELISHSSVEDVNASSPVITDHVMQDNFRPLQTVTGRAINYFPG